MTETELSIRDLTGGAPAWMGDKIWKLIVKKVGVEKLEEV